MPPTLPEQSTYDDAPQLMLKSYGISDQGRQRSSNEDRFVIAEFARNLTVHQTNIEQAPPGLRSHRENNIGRKSDPDRDSRGAKCEGIQNTPRASVVGQ